jgi:hypothetical protein
MVSKGKLTLDGGRGCSFEISDYTCERKLTFLNYIFGGTEIGINIAVDFSYSIGEHFEEEVKEALEHTIGTVSHYDSD